MFFQAITEYEFLQNAIFGLLLASLVCGMIGPFVVVQRIGYVAGSISHTMLGGMGVAYYVGFSPLVGGLISAVLAAIVVGFVGKGSAQGRDVAVGALWAVGMAVGVLFISMSPGYNADLMSYLFGNVLMIPRESLGSMLLLGAFVGVSIGFFYKSFVAVAFDEEFARLRGIPTQFFNYFLLILVALAVVVLVQVVGLILVIALLTLPAAVALLFSQSLRHVMGLSMVFGLLFCMLGLWGSYHFNLPSGASIILVAGSVYLLVWGFRGLLKER
ncbi:MAG: metal ABC transporter permease [Pseudobdellovibrionaceae bacterium]|nr:metal ABC transporter permease [Bdellovibrionales bacterium]USN48263.1 MAG: metal ABC transporter permease [Pseudobdellovibrionaceae bacterium]